ncbi:MAG TPA: nitronate monooxygenase, partial [Halanaerobiales bacterium]|nr:nitronate monooxygenase [Halanaerobiales bacterium]
VADAGADIIAIDATNRIRPDGNSLKEYIKLIKKELDLIIMGDISTIEEGLKAEEYGIDLVGTTLSGYTEYTRHVNGPNFKLLKQLVEKLSIPVIMEGKITEPEEVKKSLDMGAWAVVVGTAITRPHIITKKFTSIIK